MSDCSICGHLPNMCFRCMADMDHARERDTLRGRAEIAEAEVARLREGLDRVLMADCLAEAHAAAENTLATQFTCASTKEDT